MPKRYALWEDAHTVTAVSPQKLTAIVRVWDEMYPTPKCTKTFSQKDGIMTLTYQEARYPARSLSYRLLSPQEYAFYQWAQRSPTMQKAILNNTECFAIIDKDSNWADTQVHYDGIRSCLKFFFNGVIVNRQQLMQRWIDNTVR